MANNDDEATHNSVINRWRRDMERAEDAAQHVQKEIKKTLTEIMKSSETRRNIAIDLKKSTNNRSNYNRGEGGFGVYDDGEVITGREKYVIDDDE